MRQHGLDAAVTAGLSRQLRERHADLFRLGDQCAQVGLQHDWPPTGTEQPLEWLSDDTGERQLVAVSTNSTPDLWTGRWNQIDATIVESHIDSCQRTRATFRFA